jgi:hypothetical protein
MRIGILITVEGSVSLSEAPPALWSLCGFRVPWAQTWQSSFRALALADL